MNAKPRFHKFSGQYQRSYSTASEAQTAWEQSVRKAADENGANPVPEPSITSRLWVESTHLSSFHDQFAAPLSNPNSAQMTQNPVEIVDLTNDSDDEQPKAKRTKTQVMGEETIASSLKMCEEPEMAESLISHVVEVQAFTKLKAQHIEQDADLQTFISRRKSLEVHSEPYQRPHQSMEEKKVELSEEQKKAVAMSLRDENIFLTGAAGCGKTVTLKEILLRLKMKKRNVQVIAPTGIAALPLGGKTTFSFAGWNPDSLTFSIDDLMKKRKRGVVKAIQALDVLIIEEISMVENQFLERLNLLCQDAMSQAAVDPKTPNEVEAPVRNELPFGGKQVIFLGDFHQLPPVKPFANCLQCGGTIPQKKQPLCVSSSCKHVAQTFHWGDKWAFRAPVWKQLGLRHVRLEQIHRQKDPRFQDILNKIRNGAVLNDDEWRDLERPKQLPRGAFAVRLMSRLSQVNAFNERELAALRYRPKTWVALDSSRKLVGGKEYEGPAIEYKLQEHKDSLKDHRFQRSLKLIVGARVVLLYNLNHEKGLVNGSQGVVVGFKPAAAILEKHVSGEQKEWRMDQIALFQGSRDAHYWRPLVRFSNGVLELIPAFASASLRGGPQATDQYLACRTQIPLTLAWAPSIHKSQGMTLEYVEVSSRDIFESGQLYVTLSRATNLEGLNVTGFSREQLPMDKDVLEFYATAKWEKLQPRRKRESS